MEVMIRTDNSAVIENILKENESLRKRIATLEGALFNINEKLMMLTLTESLSANVYRQFCDIGTKATQALEQEGIDYDIQN